MELLSARDLAARIARGETSALDAVEASIARIEDMNGALNAVCVKRYEEARREAREADARRAAGAPLGPLHGVPVTVKESLDLAGTPSTFGITGRRRERAASDAPAVAALRAAGGIVVGKTNVAQMLLFLESDNPLYGRVNNPWDPQRSSGGSSGGEGAIVAAGGSMLGLGTDIGGSCRIPAAFCGIVGIKPTGGRIDDEGRFSVPPGQRAIPSQVGVLARDVADAALALRVAAAARRRDGEPPRPIEDPAGVDVAQLRVAFFTNDGTFTPAPAARRAVTEAAKLLSEAGASVSEWRPPHAGEALYLLFALLAGDGGRGIARALGSSPRDARVKLLETVAGASSAMRAGLRVLLRLTGRAKLAELLPAYGHTTVDEHWQLVDQLMTYRERWLQALDDGPFDVVLSPACGLPAVRHGATAELGLIGAYSCLWNVLGWPAGVVPFTTVGKDEESDRPPSKDKLDIAAIATEQGSAGLPIGVQLAAPPWQEHVVLAAMAAVEEAAKGRPEYPRLPAGR